MKRELVIKDINSIDAAAAQFLVSIKGKNIIALFGVMGAGKTTFIKALCKNLGVKDDVNSPTFTLINEYKNSMGDPIYHFDFYRIDKLTEAYDIGIDEFFDSDRLCLIEWPEKIEQILPPETLRVEISVQTDGSRLLTYFSG